ncbi:MAG: dihydropteroate synthase [Methanobacteriota archaeon]
MREKTLRWRGGRMDFGEITRILGIVNVTPDSFSDAGRSFDPARAIEHGVAMAAEGADAIDVGGESTRPGSTPVPAAEEIRRVIPVIEGLAKRIEVPISVDTSKADVARAALAAGASWVNDVTALTGDPAMGRVVSETGAAVILMHMRGTPATMQAAPRYDDVVSEVVAYFAERTERAVAQGIDRDRVMLDPGIGFGKAPRHNLELIAGLPAFARLGRPILVGHSKKSFISAASKGEAPAGRLPGTLAAGALARWSGADMLRVHDVADARQASAVVDALRGVRRDG